MEATQAAEDDDGSEQGCLLQGMLRLKGVGFLEYGEVEWALRKVRGDRQRFFFIRLDEW